MTRKTDPSEIPAEPPPGAEPDPRFPSGPWTGFFLQPMLSSQKLWMELSLSFRDAVMTGEGRDKVGSFVIRGRYDLKDGKCWWTKRYIGKHDVAYLGYNEGKGIWGIWEIKAPPLRGGFHIWPLGMADPTGAKLAAEAEIPDVSEPILEPVSLPEPEPVTAGEGASVAAEPDSP